MTFAQLIKVYKQDVNADRRYAPAEVEATALDVRLFKEMGNLWAAYCLHFAHYNFCRVHRRLRVTPRWSPASPARCGEIADLLN